MNKIDIPLDEYVVLERREDGPHTNVPVIVLHHSPTGFEWGYGGSGPADLALNILENLLRMTGHSTCQGEAVCEQAWAHYETFKWAFIAPMPREGGRIYTNDILAWLKAQ